MNKYKLYRKIKAEYAYSLFKNNQTFEKVRAIIIKDGKVLLLHKVHTDKYALPGGGVEYEENIEIAVERECYEEAKAKVKFKSIVGILNNDVDMVYEKEHFVSTRVEYYCLCEFVSFIKKKKHFGLNGEFFDRVEVVWLNVKDIEKAELSDYVVHKIKKAMKILSNVNTDNILKEDKQKNIDIQKEKVQHIKVQTQYSNKKKYIGFKNNSKYKKNKNNSHNRKYNKESEVAH